MNEFVTLTELAYRTYHTTNQMKRLMQRGAVTPNHKSGTSYIFVWDNAVVELKKFDPSTQFRPPTEWNVTPGAERAGKHGPIKHIVKFPTPRTEAPQQRVVTDVCLSDAAIAAKDDPLSQIDESANFDDILKLFHTDMSTDSAKRVREIMRARREVLELKKEEQTYVDVQEFIPQFVEVAVIMQRQMRSLVPRVAAELAATTDIFKVRHLLEAEIMPILSSLKSFISDLQAKHTESRSTDNIDTELGGADAED